MHGREPGQSWLYICGASEGEIIGSLRCLKIGTPMLTPHNDQESTRTLETGIMRQSGFTRKGGLKAAALIGIKY